MKLALRDQLAEWILEALADPGHEAPVRALVAFARSTDGDGVARGLSAEERAALRSGEALFEEIADGLRLRPDLGRDLAALRERAIRFGEALEASRRACGAAPPTPRRPDTTPDDTELTWTLCAAAALFDAGLFFEVHELLEPPWRRADEPLRSFLQGLIQVAVGFHHRATGNRRGAVALLEDGVAKLRSFEPAAYGVGIADLDRGAEAAAEALRAGKPCDSDAPPAPRLRFTA